MFVDYGQATGPGEECAAQAVSAARGVELEMVRVGDLARLGAGTLANTQQSVLADGAFEQQREEWFPGRNLMLAATGMIALARSGGGELAFGAVSDSCYRDARPQFFQSAEAAIRESLPASIGVAVTVPSGSRLEALRAACAAGLEPRLTFSCNRRADRHCWRCTSCRDRIRLLTELSTAKSAPGDRQR